MAPDPQGQLVGARILFLQRFSARILFPHIIVETKGLFCLSPAANTDIGMINRTIISASGFN